MARGNLSSATSLVFEMVILTRGRNSTLPIRNIEFATAPMILRDVALKEFVSAITSFVRLPVDTMGSVMSRPYAVTDVSKFGDNQVPLTDSKRCRSGSNDVPSESVGARCDVATSARYTALPVCTLRPAPAPIKTRSNCRATRPAPLNCNPADSGIMICPKA